MVDKRLTSNVMRGVTLLQKKMSSLLVEEFMQYFVGTVVLVVGLSLLSLNLTTFTTKMFFHSHVMDIRIDTTFFTMPATGLCLPCFFLTTCLSFNRRQLFFTLIALQIMAMIAIVAGYSVGTKYQPKFSNETLRLGSTIPKQYINNTLYTFVTQYENNTEYKTSMDKIQAGLKCCGVYSKEDFTTIPTSCCPYLDCQNNTAYRKGCLRSMQEDIAWNKNVTLSLTHLGILLYLFNGIMMVSVYTSYYHRWKEVTSTTRKKYTK